MKVDKLLRVDSGKISDTSRKDWKRFFLNEQPVFGADNTDKLIAKYLEKSFVYV